MTPLQTQLKEFWRRLSLPDLIAAALVVIGALLFVLGRSGGIYNFLKYISLLCAGYVLIRVIGWWRSKLLWSLRNRLIVAYLFIALVPVVLTAVLAFFFAILLYRQFGGYILYQDLQRRIDMVSAGTDQIAAALETAPLSMQEEAVDRVIMAQEHAVYDTQLPGMHIEINDRLPLLAKVADTPRRKYAGFIQKEKSLFLVGLRAVKTPYGERFVHVRVPVSSSFVSSLAPELGPVEFQLLEPLDGANQQSLRYTLSSRDFQVVTRVVDTKRLLRGAQGFWDTDVTGVTRFDAKYEYTDGSVDPARPVVAVFTTRPSHLNVRMFSTVGDLGLVYVYTLGLLAVIFFLLEIAALVTGIVMTRRITSAIDGLYQATVHIQNEDYSYHVKIESRDQLGVLGESFNLMTTSIRNSIEERERHHRLENEISIAREVQNQLFPQKLPTIPGVEIEAVCKAARMVSGDYYDFIQLSPTRLAIAVADISGKGISAALLMASLQAALRSQLLAPGSADLSTGELVSRLNNHLVRNTGDDRFATFFIAIYDSATRILRYTNAGHLPSFCICDEAAVALEEGGMVLGVVEDYEYAEGRHLVPKNATLVGYSDGLIEPENVYGEEFGIRRLRDAAIRLQHGSPNAIARGLMQAADEWAGTPEQADDMTVIVARLE
jgi:sigma-B regulation protein RsbU (phosphoserine phosphatase)